MEIYDGCAGNVGHANVRLLRAASFAEMDIETDMPRASHRTDPNGLKKNGMDSMLRRGCVTIDRCI